MGFAREKNYRGGMFSQRHYQAIAKELNRSFVKYHKLGMDWALEPLNEVLMDLTALFQGDNNNFKPDLFNQVVMKGVK